MQGKSFFRIETIVPLVLLVSLLFPFSVTHAQDWYNANWLFRKPITLDPASGGVDLANFPVLIATTDTDLADEALTNGGDILFTADDGTTKLDHEIESYSDATGDLVAWVKVPSLSSGSSTVVYMYYGTSTTPLDQENPAGVWDSNYVMVQHLEETSGNHNDSTINTNNSNEVVGADQTVSGNIDGADEFDGTDDYVRVPDAGTLQFGEDSFTAEAWINPQPITDSGGARIVNNRGTGTGGTVAGWQLKIQNDTGRWRFGDAGIDDADSGFAYTPYNGTTTYAYNDWYHVVMIYEADTALRFYVNGVEDGTLSLRNYGSITNDHPTVIGASIVHDGVEHADDKQFFDGRIDEVRLSDSTRSVGWIQTSYTNQDDPAAFHGIGTEEPQCTVDANCDDGEFCTGVETCVSGACQAGSDPCPDDTLFCTGTESCDEGGDQCLSTGDPCPGPDGDNNCSESCNEATDNCTSADPNGAACNDDTYCNGADTCNAGACSDHVGDPCTDDLLFCTGTESCDEVGDQCVSSGDPCVSPEVCNETSDVCELPSDCVVDDDCADDGIGCTDETCDGGTCVSNPNDANCSEDGTFCNGIEYCDAALGCSSPGDPCTPPDVCDEAGDVCTTVETDWWDGLWLFRKKITIDPAKVTDDLTNFPVLIDITDADLATYAQDDGDDLAFTDDNAMQLSHEIETYNTGSGHLVAWVNVPDVSSTEDTVLYLYFGNSIAGNQEDVSGTWDSGYVMVQHLDETTGPHFDSTINANDGTPVDVFDQNAMGKIAGADEFDDPETPAEINVGTNASMDVFGPNQDFSIFLWVKRAASTEVEGFFSSGSSPDNGIYFGSAYTNTDDLKFMSLGQTVQIDSTTGVIGDTEWHLVGVTADRDGNLEFWVDGDLKHSESIATHAAEDWNRLDDTYKIGTDRSELSPMDGVIDEVRLSDEVRSDGWIQTSYTNQNDPAAFYQCGPIEAEPDADGDGMPDGLDNCPSYPNGPLQGTCTLDDGVNLIVSTGQFCTVDTDCDPGEFCEMTQADNYPPDGNGIGDACDCEADFDCDVPGADVDAINVEQFLWDFGRSLFNDPCTDLRPCFGDFTCDSDVDADDVPKLLEDFGRSLYENPCPAPPVCVVGDRCVYP
jgi:hypothetical protein